MRRIMHNTTAIAASLSLLLPQLAQAQFVLAEAHEEQPIRRGQSAPAEQVPQEEDPKEAAPERAQRDDAKAPPAKKEKPAAKRAEQDESKKPKAPAKPKAAAAAPQAKPAQQGAGADSHKNAAPKADRPAQAAREGNQKGGAKADAQGRKAERAEGRDARQSAKEKAVDKANSQRPKDAARQQQNERPAAAARQQQGERPAAAAREQQDERPAAAARQQQGERPTAAAREQQDERPAAAARQQQGERPAAAARQQKDERPAAAARQQQGERPAPAAREQAAPPSADAADGVAQRGLGEEDVRKALEARQKPQSPAAGAGGNQNGGQGSRGADGNAADGNAAPGEGAVREGLARKQDRQGAPTGQGGQPAPGNAAPQKSQAAKQAAQERRAGSAAAALDSDQKGKVVEQRITEENSRSSDEDFNTTIRQAAEPNANVRPRDQEPRADNDDDDDDNDLAKALLLGLGAVAVGTYLNNNRQVALSAPDRIVVTRDDGSQELIKDEVALLRQPGSTVTTENFDDGSSRTVVTRADGSRVVTIRDADLRVLRRTLVSADGMETRLIDDTAEVEPVDLATLPAPAPVPTAGVYDDEATLRDALQRQDSIDRRFTLGQVRAIPEVRSLVPPVNIDAITFDTGSAAISPDQARQLSTLGSVIQTAITENPREIFLIEGHTDTVGSGAANLALSDRRAESVALALSEYFDVPPENLVVQGYGEQFPRLRQDGDIRENRRAAVRRITDLLQTAEVQ